MPTHIQKRAKGQCYGCGDGDILYDGLCRDCIDEIRVKENVEYIEKATEICEYVCEHPNHDIQEFILDWCHKIIKGFRHMLTPTQLEAVDAQWREIDERILDR